MLFHQLLQYSVAIFKKKTEKQIDVQLQFITFENVLKIYIYSQHRHTTENSYKIVSLC